MTIDEITDQVRRNTYGLLNDGEVVYAVQMALSAHGGVDPADVVDVEVVFEKSSLDIRMTVREPEQLTLF
jgi:hypothetical protein